MTGTKPDMQILDRAMVIVDTSIWIQAFREYASPECSHVDLLLAGGKVAMVGIVLSEILKGARNQEDFGRLREDMTRLPYLETTQETWITAGALSYQLRVKGVTVSLPDLVIASLAMEGDHEVYTLDNHFQRIPGLKLYNVVATG